MSAPETGTARRWSALLLFVAAPAVLLLLAAANLVAALDARDRGRELAFQADRLRTRAAAQTAAPAAAPSDPAPLFVAAASRSLAEAALQLRVVALVAEASARIVESGTLEPAAGAPADLLVLRVALDVDNGGLLRFLHAVETGLPLMSVADLAVRTAPSEGAGGPERLRAEAVIQARWKAPNP